MKNVESSALSKIKIVTLTGWGVVWWHRGMRSKRPFNVRLKSTYQLELRAIHQALLTRSEMSLHVCLIRQMIPQSVTHAWAVPWCSVCTFEMVHMSRGVVAAQVVSQIWEHFGEMQLSLFANSKSTRCWLWFFWQPKCFHLYFNYHDSPQADLFWQFPSSKLVYVCKGGPYNSEGCLHVI